MTATAPGPTALGDPGEDLLPLERTAAGLAGIFGLSVLGSIDGWPTLPDSTWELIQVTSLLAAVSIVLIRGQRLRLAHVAIAILGGYGALTLASALTAGDVDLALETWQVLIRGLLVGFTAYLFSSTLNQLRSLVWGSVLGVSAVALGSLTGQFGLGALNAESGRLMGPVGDPNFFAQFQAVGFALSAQLAVSRRSLAVRQGRSSIAGAMAIVAAGLCATAVFVSESRGGMLAVGVTGLMLAVQLNRRDRRRLGVAAVLLVLLVLNTTSGQRLTRTPASVSETLATGVAEDTAVSGRLSETIAAFRMFVDHPIFGVGYANYPHHYLDYAMQIQIDNRTEERHAHDIHLEILAETGIIGGLFWVTVITVVLTGLGRARREDVPGGSLGRSAAALRLAFIAWLLTSVFLHDSFPGLQWFLVGAALGACDIATSRRVAAGPARAAAPTA